MSEFFTSLEQILYADDIDKKFNDFFNFIDDFKSKKMLFNHEAANVLKDNFHPNLRLKEVIKIKRIKEPNSKQSLAVFLHAIAHIEFSAINLALDTSYRFRFLPFDFYKDFLEVAEDEIRHFSLLEKALNELGYKYTDFEAHDTIHSACKATANSLKYRMAVVHRGLEAKGLDANVFVLKKIQNESLSLKKFLEETLKIILDDEINHVSKGDIWWKANKDEQESFIEICAKFKSYVLAGKILNKEARLKAGFDESELDELEDFYKNKHKFT
ncbi:DUF455 domain protein [Campylobacter avium LMG 24591]|uniref:DUF455 domain protein n=1 Tax=Campylobacter avium LMG 24591 TaxID=522484 RepID=A0A222MZC9_9BACT|nr:DUF455 family protein [Campylobacter avium]ASQ30922.1 DUF455 domain protein [Campylobacter avium LMG 24591]OYD78734.1 hypothetical protein CAV8706_1293 [Campylobacter avium]